MLISRTAGYHGTHGFGTAIAGIAANRVGFDPEEETIQVPHDSLEAMRDGDRADSAPSASRPCSWSR